MMILERAEEVLGELRLAPNPLDFPYDGLFYPHVFAQKGRHIEVLSFYDCGLAFFKTTAGERFKL
jgi:hypothetical protein